MFTYKIKYYLLFLSITFLASCDKEIDIVKLPEFVQQLVINSFISPADTVSYITVTSNRRVFGELNYEEDPGNLTATLSDGSREIALDTTILGFKFYPEDMAIEEGKTYTLKIQSDKGLMAEASCTVPFNRKIEIEVDTFSRTYNYHEMPNLKAHLADIYLTDYAGEENYYRLLYKQVSYYTDDKYPPWDQNFYSLRAKGLSDSARDGMRSLIGTVNIYNDESIDSSFLKIKIMYTDKAYFTFHKSLDTYSNDENPFAEISPVFSNIKEGLGIFAAYSIDSISFRLK